MVTMTRTTAPVMGRTEFFMRLGVSKQFWHRRRMQGLMPEPPRISGSRFLMYSEDYLQACRKALDEARRLDIARRRLTRRKMKELSDAGVL